MLVTLVSPRIAIQKGDFLGSGIPYWPIELAILAAESPRPKGPGERVKVIDLFGADPFTLEDKGEYYLQGSLPQTLINQVSLAGTGSRCHLCIILYVT